jgi:hypothetical protein
VVLDPFCGCGTTVAAAQRLGRRWIGIDVTHLAINLIRVRLTDTYGKTGDLTVVGEPISVDGAAELASSDPYQFEWWALGLVGARPAEGKKRADRGIDGRLYWHEGRRGKTHQVIISVLYGRYPASSHRDDVHLRLRLQPLLSGVVPADTPPSIGTEEAVVGVGGDVLILALEGQGRVELGVRTVLPLVHLGGGLGMPSPYRWVRAREQLRTGAEARPSSSPGVQSCAKQYVHRGA